MSCLYCIRSIDNKRFSVRFANRGCVWMNEWMNASSNHHVPVARTSFFLSFPFSLSHCSHVYAYHLIVSGIPNEIKMCRRIVFLMLFTQTEQNTKSADAFSACWHNLWWSWLWPLQTSLHPNAFIHMSDVYIQPYMKKRVHTVNDVLNWTAQVVACRIVSSSLSSLWPT